MFRTLSDFFRDWDYNAGATHRMLDSLTDESLLQEVTSQERNLGRIGWHMVTSIHVLMSPTGLHFESPRQDQSVPNSSKVLAESFRKASDNFIQAVKDQWTDDDLKVVKNVFGRDLPNGVTLSLLNQHQIHHRGQITVLMRQVGLKVPGVYGPAREEWASLGLEAPT